MYFCINLLQMCYYFFMGIPYLTIIFCSHLIAFWSLPFANFFFKNGFVFSSSLLMNILCMGMSTLFPCCLHMIGKEKNMLKETNFILVRITMNNFSFFGIVREHEQNNACVFFLFPWFSYWSIGISSFL